MSDSVDRQYSEGRPPSEEEFHDSHEHVPPSPSNAISEEIVAADDPMSMFNNQYRRPSFSNVVLNPHLQAAVAAAAQAANSNNAAPSTAQSPGTHLPPPQSSQANYRNRKPSFSGFSPSLATLMAVNPQQSPTPAPTGGLDQLFSAESFPGYIPYSRTIPQSPTFPPPSLNYFPTNVGSEESAPAPGPQRSRMSEERTSKTPRVSDPSTSTSQRRSRKKASEPITIPSTDEHEEEGDDEDVSESGTKGRQSQSSTIPRTVDVFKSALSFISSETLRTLRHYGYFVSNSNYETDNYVKTTIQMSVEIWILSFGIHVIDVSYEQFLQCIANVQQINARYRWGMTNQDIEKLFWLSGAALVTESDFQESIAMISMPEFCLILTWLGFPDTEYPIRAPEAVRRAYTWLNSSKNRLNCFEGLSSPSKAETQVLKRFPPAILRVPPGGLEVVNIVLPSGTMVRRIRYAIRNLVCTRVNETGVVLHEIVFDDYQVYSTDTASSLIPSDVEVL